MRLKELMLKQIDVTLKQEINYLEFYNNKLKEKNITDLDRERMIIFRQSCISAIERCKKWRK